MKHTGLVLDEVFCRHDTGPGHPESPERMAALLERLSAPGLGGRCTRIDPEPAGLEQVAAVHDRSYIDRLREHCANGRGHIDCPDSAVCPQTFEIARLAAGAVVGAAGAVARGELGNAFCAVRPPGHHAERDASMGFCMFNNVAIAARSLAREHGLERILILDWDVHHGNGTQHAFEAEPGVLFCSLHGHPDTLYPGTGYAHERGRGPGTGTTLNLPMMPFAGDAEYRTAFRRQVLPAARSYGPQFILISAGFDAHRRDPLAQIQLETSSFDWLSRQALALAAECCGGRLVSILEGGYDLEALADCAAAHLEALLDA